MKFVESNAQTPRLMGQLLERLHNPVQLRAVVTGVVLLVAYAGVYLPLSGQIDATARKLASENKRLDLARAIEHLRAQYKNFKHRLAEKADSNEWIEYVLGGVRRFPLKLVTLDSDPARDLGPYKAIVLRIELEGQFPEMNGFLGWLETNERLLRVDGVRIQPHRSGNGILVMQVTVLGVMS